ncbi:MAG: ribonuclease P protein component [Verrucomicrobiales bacterium]|nr:ribonuclease P protein component [Verrucomicrobiales bacterium]
MKFPRTRRITRRADFQRVRKHGKSVNGRFLVLGYLSEESIGPSKLGLITTKRLGNAVVRNRVRRRLRGIMQRIGDRFLPGHWLVLIARNAAATATSEQLEKEWKWLMHRASLMAPKETES